MVEATRVTPQLNPCMARLPRNAPMHVVQEQRAASGKLRCVEADNAGANDVRRSSVINSNILVGGLSCRGKESCRVVVMP